LPARINGITDATGGAWAGGRDEDDDESGKGISEATYALEYTVRSKIETAAAQVAVALAHRALLLP
jgi:hypothetical protein